MILYMWKGDVEMKVVSVLPTHSVRKTFGKQKRNSGNDLPQRVAEMRLLCVPSVSSAALYKRQSRGFACMVELG